MDNIMLSPEGFNFLVAIVREAIRQIPAISACYLVGYSIVAVVHEFWPRYAILAYFGLAVSVGIFGGQH